MPRATPPTPRVSRTRALLVAGGGAIGAVCRWLVGEAIPADELAAIPWALLVVNVAGSAALAIAIVASRRRPEHASLLVDGVGTGFCGGLTTFSAFAVTTAEQLRGGEAVWAAASTVVMVAVGLAASAIVLAVAERPRRGPGEARL